jgi:23S rRNA pseudouridine1911/1915/1917 synthase
MRPALRELPAAGIVHRLDKDTSGLMVVAKSEAAQLSLVRQLQARTVKRTYLAVVRGVVGAAGKVDAPIGRHPVHRTRMAVVPSGKPAVTHYRVRRRFARHTLLECDLETGRTHQIRVHLASIGHALEGDPVYSGRGERLLGRQALHAWKLAFDHPRTGTRRAFRVAHARGHRGAARIAAEKNDAASRMAGPGLARARARAGVRDYARRRGERG